MFKKIMNKKVPVAHKYISAGIIIVSSIFAIALCVIIAKSCF